jgi:hypothetical protein
LIVVVPLNGFSLQSFFSQVYYLEQTNTHGIERKMIMSMRILVDSKGDTGTYDCDTVDLVGMNGIMMIGANLSSLYRSRWHEVDHVLWGNEVIHSIIVGSAMTTYVATMDIMRFTSPDDTEQRFKLTMPIHQFGGSGMIMVVPAILSRYFGLTAVDMIEELLRAHHNHNAHLVIPIDGYLDVSLFTNPLVFDSLVFDTAQTWYRETEECSRFFLNDIIGSNAVENLDIETVITCLGEKIMNEGIPQYGGSDDNEHGEEEEQPRDYTPRNSDRWKR